MREACLEVLKTYFGYPEFRENQAAIVEHVAAGGDALVLMATGGGKSLCFQIPAIVRSGLCIVVSPLVSLINDQVRELTKASVPAVALTSETARPDAVWADIRQNRLKLLYVSPERFTSPTFLARLMEFQTHVGLFAIDEAHCVSTWGNGFREDYTRLAGFMDHFPGTPRVAVTGTADPVTRRDIAQSLGLRSAVVFTSTFDRPNLRMDVEYSTDKFARVSKFILPRRGQAGIIYCRSRAETEKLTDRLVKERGLQALCYHAGMDASVKRENQEHFLRSEGVVMVATTAFGMGINKPNVRFVVHTGMSSSLEGFYQEIGRAGRDGELSSTLGLYNESDLYAIIRHHNGGKTPGEAERLTGYLRAIEGVGCRRNALLAGLGETLSDPCGRCDRCLSPPPLLPELEASESVRKLLSVCARMGDNAYGIGYLCEILVGDVNERTVMRGHASVLGCKTFGTGRNRPVSYWKTVARQALAAGLFVADAVEERSGSAVWRMTTKGREVMLGKQPVIDSLAVYTPQTQEIALENRPVSVEMASGAPAELKALHGKLGVVRDQYAKRLNVPHSIIMTDSAIISLSEQLPSTETDVAAIIGTRRLASGSFCADILRVIATYQEQNAPKPQAALAPSLAGFKGFTRM